MAYEVKWVRFCKDRFFFNNVGLNVEDTGMGSVMETGIIGSNEFLRRVGGNDCEAWN